MQKEQSVKMVRFSGLIVFVLGIQFCLCAKDYLKPDPPELLRYKSLKNKRLLFEKFRETQLFTVPGYSGKEADTDDEPPFVPSLECGDEYFNLTKGTFGTITSPNYPRKYLPDLNCEWVLESVPGTVIEATIFDSVTQPWLFAWYDYVKISLNGEWGSFYRFAGDVNYKTPYTLVSEGNRMIIRFISSSWLNFRGFSLFYVVRNRGKTDISPPMNEWGSAINNNVVAVCQRKPETPPRPNDKYTDLSAQNTKIINGEVTVPHKYPFTVALLIDGQNFCSGTLIDDVNVITAAHCVEDAERIVLIFGLHNMTNPAERYYSRQIRLVEFPDTSNHVFVHPHFNPDTGANDIAIVRVLQKVRFTGYVQPIYLPSVFSASNSFYGKVLKTVGWGQFDLDNQGISTVLREGPARVISNGDCREEYRGAITGTNICTLTPYIPTEEGNGTNGRPPPPRRKPNGRNLRNGTISNEDEESTSTFEPSTEAPTTVPPPPPTGESEGDGEGANEVEAEQEYVSPCLGDAGGPLFTEFKETSPGSKETTRHECVEAKPNGSGLEDLKSHPACDRPHKEEFRQWYVLVGVVSFGSSVCGEEIPVAYQRVSGHLEWIAYVTGRHG